MNIDREQYSLGVQKLVLFPAEPCPSLLKSYVDHFQYTEGEKSKSNDHVWRYIEHVYYEQVYMMPACAGGKY